MGASDEQDAVTKNRQECVREAERCLRASHALNVGLSGKAAYIAEAQVWALLAAVAPEPEVRVEKIPPGRFDSRDLVCVRPGCLHLRSQHDPSGRCGDVIKGWERDEPCRCHSFLISREDGLASG